MLRINYPHTPLFARWRSFRVFIDGTRSGSVKNGGSEDFEVTAGEHRVQVRMDWCKSPEVGVSVGSNVTVTLTATTTVTKPSLRAVWDVVVHQSQIVTLTSP